MEKKEIEVTEIKFKISSDKEDEIDYGIIHRHPKSDGPLDDKMKFTIERIVQLIKERETKTKEVEGKIMNYPKLSNCKIEIFIKDTTFEYNDKSSK